MAILQEGVPVLSFKYGLTLDEAVTICAQLKEKYIHVATASGMDAEYTSGWKCPSAFGYICLEARDMAICGFRFPMCTPKLQSYSGYLRDYDWRPTSVFNIKNY